MVGEEKIGKVGLKVVLDVVPSAKLMRGKRTGTRPPVWWISSERVLIEIYFFPPPPAFITNATVIANSGFDRSNYFSSSVRALIACFMAGVSHLSSNRSPDKRSDYRRFDSNEGLKYRLINSMLVKNWREFVPRAGVSPWNFSGSRERLWNWCKTRSGLKKKKTKLRVHIDGNIHTRTCSEKKYRICNKIYTYICIYFLKKIHNATSVRA